MKFTQKKFMRLIVAVESGRTELRPIDNVEKIIKRGGGTIRYVDEKGDGIAINCEGIFMENIEGIVIKKSIISFSSMKLSGRESIEEMQNYRFSDRVIVQMFKLIPPRPKEF